MKRALLALGLSALFAMNTANAANATKFETHDYDISKITSYTLNPKKGYDIFVFTTDTESPTNSNQLTKTCAKEAITDNRAMSDALQQAFIHGFKLTATIDLDVNNNFFDTTACRFVKVKIYK